MEKLQSSLKNIYEFESPLCRTVSKYIGTGSYKREATPRTAQTVCLRSVQGAKSTTRNETLCVLVNVLPIYIQLEDIRAMLELENYGRTNLFGNELNITNFRY